MMNRPHDEARLLAIAPSTYGFGFAVLEGNDLIDWGVKTVTGDKNRKSLLKFRELIELYAPGALVLQGKNTPRSKRIKRLHQDFIEEARKLKLNIVQLNANDLRKAFFPEGGGTKHRIAENLAARFPQELGSRLPPKRQPWMSEDFRMGIFNAVALIIAATGTAGMLSNVLGGRRRQSRFEGTAA